MRANRGKDTAPELALRSELHRRGYRFRKNLRLDLAPGRRLRPDIVFQGLRLAVFVDGCYWHGCEQHRSIPTSNSAFWRAKIEGTRQRDAAHIEWLRSAGWTVLRCWEHEPVDQAADRVTEALEEAQRRHTLK